MNPIDQSPGIKAQGDIVKPSEGSSRVRSTDTRSTGAGGSSGQADGEFVTVTRTATELLRLEQQLESMPEVNRERVDALRQAIADGRYEVNPERITDALLRAEQELY